MQKSWEDDLPFIGCNGTVLYDIKKESYYSIRDVDKKIYQKDNWFCNSKQLSFLVYTSKGIYENTRDYKKRRDFWKIIFYENQKDESI